MASNRARIAELRTQRAAGPVDLADVLATPDGRIVFPLLFCPCVLHLIAAPVMAIGLALARW